MAGATTQAERQAQVLAAGYNGPLTDEAINQAYANAATPSDLAQSGISNRPIVSAAAPSATVTTNSPSSQQLATGINSLLGAIASGNKQAFDEAVRQFNLTFGLDQSKFDESVRQYNLGYGISQAGLTGSFNGSPTLGAQQQGFSQDVALAQLLGYYTPNATAVPGVNAGNGAPLMATVTEAQYIPARTQQLQGMGYSADSAKQTAQAEWAQGFAQTGNVAGGLPPSLTANTAATNGLTHDAYIPARTAQLQQLGWTQEAAAQTANAEWAQGYAQAGTVAGGMPAGLATTPGGSQAAAQAQAAGGAAPAPQRQITLANIAQQNAIAQAWAQQYGYVPQFDANGQPIFQPGTGPGGGSTTLAAQQQAYSQQLGAIQAAAALQANPFRQQQVLGQLWPTLGGVGGVPGFAAPNTVAGVGTQGGNTQGGFGYMQQIIDDIKNPGANQANVQGVLDAIPTPNKINSQDFLRSAPSTQNMILQGMQEKYGLDPNDSLAQIKNTLPSFTSPSTFGTIKG